MQNINRNSPDGHTSISFAQAAVEITTALQSDDYGLLLTDKSVMLNNKTGMVTFTARNERDRWRLRGLQELLNAYGVWQVEQAISHMSGLQVALTEESTTYHWATRLGRSFSAADQAKVLTLWCGESISDYELTQYGIARVTAVATAVLNDPSIEFWKTLEN